MYNVQPVLRFSLHCDGRKFGEGPYIKAFVQIEDEEIRVFMVKVAEYSHLVQSPLVQNHQHVVLFLVPTFS